MVATTLKLHWEKIYAGNPSGEFSWHQDLPEVSLALIRSCHLASAARIIDVGGGDSTLVDCLLRSGFGSVAVLDISGNALRRAKDRLGEEAARVVWVEADALEDRILGEFDLWHDRAAFHFLTRAEEVARYADLAGKSVVEGGFLIVGTFSDSGPKSCSGLPVQQYSENSIARVFSACFDLVLSRRIDHLTPAGKQQNFLFAVFRRRMRD